MNDHDEFGLLKYLARVEQRFDQVEGRLAAVRKDVSRLRAEFHAFGRQVAKSLANHRRRIEALERRVAQ